MLTPDRITLVLSAPEGGSLEQVLHFTKLGAHVSIGRGLAVIAGASEGDLQAELEALAQVNGREREERGHTVGYCERAMGMHPLLVAHAREMHDLLHLINVKVGGLRAVCDHGGDPSDEMWEQFDHALDQIWPMLEMLAPAIAERDTQAPTFNIDDHVRLAADAKRYRWLRDVAATTGSGHTPMVKVAGGPGRWRTGEDLDQSLDQAMRSWSEQKADQELQP